MINRQTASNLTHPVSYVSVFVSKKEVRMCKRKFLVLSFAFLVIFLVSVVSLLVSVYYANAAATETQTVQETNTEWIKTELYLSRDTQTCYEVTQKQFEKFLDKVVTKNFPKGFTVYNAYGQYQEPDMTIAEKETWVIVIIHEKTPENEKAVETVIDAYRKQFDMAQILRTTAPVEAKFYAQV